LIKLDVRQVLRIEIKYDEAMTQMNTYLLAIVLKYRAGTKLR
jgi:hypothetical protein